MTELEKMQAGLPYSANDAEVSALKQRAMELCHRLNALDPAEKGERDRVSRLLLGSAGEGLFLGPNFQCDVGSNIHVGQHFFANYNVTILDRAEVRMGDYVMIAPNVLISAVGHPLSPVRRRQRMSVAKPVRIGDDVWIGGGAVILPGVTIGNNVVVAAGAVVTRDVPDNSLAMGVPAKVVKQLDLQ